MKHFLILATAPINVVLSDLDFLFKKKARKSFKITVLTTRDLEHEAIDEKIIYPKNRIEPEDTFNLSKFDDVIVLFSAPWRIEYINIFRFLRKNNIYKTILLKNDFSMKRISIKNFNRILYLMLKFFDNYRKMGF